MKPRNAKVAEEAVSVEVSEALKRLAREDAGGLARLGIRTAKELLDYPPLRSARVLVAMARGSVREAGFAYVKEEFRDEASKAAALPLRALRGMTEEGERVLERLGVRSVSDLAAFATDVDEFVIKHTDNGFSERPSAPAELLPTMIGSIASSVRYSTFVEDGEVRGLRIGVMKDCFVPLPITPLILKNPKVPAVTDVFTDVPCPLFRLGYICDHRQRWINLGTNLGEVVHSISLGPGQSRNLALVNWRRRQLTKLEENTSTAERLTSTFVQSRALEEVTSAVAREHQTGQTKTEANTMATAASFVGAGAAVGGVAGGVSGAVIGGIIGSVEPGAGNVIGALAGGAIGAGVGGVAGAAAGGLVYSGSQALGMIESATEGDREIVADVHQRITLNTSQHASAVRSLWSTVVVEDAQAESVEVTTSNVTNYNHMHALNLEFYEVLQHYIAQIELRRVEPILFLPFGFFDFTGFAFIRDYWEAVRPHVDVNLQAQGDAFFVEDGVPAAPDLLVVPPPPEPPAAPGSLTLNDLEIELVFKSEGGIFSGLTNLLSDVNVEVRKGSASVEPTNPDGTPVPGLEPDEVGQRFNFPSIPNATAIDGVRLKRSQVFPMNIRYRMRVRKGSLVGQGAEEDLDGSDIAVNRLIAGSDTSLTFVVPWTPAQSALGDTAAAQLAYEALVAERNAVIAENAQRQAAYEALATDFDRFKARLERLVMRRRHFFTRVILQAIEPEELAHLLESLTVQWGPTANREIPLHVFAHTVPVGYAGGALILKLKRLSRTAAERLFDKVAAEPAELGRLLRYADETLAFFADVKNREAAGRTEHVYLPTGGLFAESILGRANAAEYLDVERYFDWQTSPIPHQAPDIQAVGTESRHQSTQDISINAPAETLNIQSPVTLPDPTGLTGVLAAIQNGSIFRDMSKAQELVGVVGKLTELSGKLGEASATMTGDAAKQAMQSATEIGKAASSLAQAMFSETMKQAGSAFGNLTELGATLNKARELDARGGGSGPGPGTGAGGGGGAGRPSIEEETFREFVGSGGDGVTFANFTRDGGGGGAGESELTGAEAFASGLAAAAAEFPGIDFSIGEPSPRNCCAIFPGGVMGLFKSEYLDLARVPGHSFGSSGFFPADSVGHVYTLRGGFVDLGHVRDLADYARYLTVRALELQRSGGVVPLVAEGGTRRLRVVAQGVETPNLELAAMVGLRAAYDCAVWHEIVTWFTSIRHSSFSPEDNFSNLLGAMLGASACLMRGRDYNNAMDEVLVTSLKGLGDLPGAEARQAIDEVAGLWFDANNDLSAALLGDAAGNDLLRRRHLDVGPVVTPWLVTDLHGGAFTIPDPVAGPGVDRTIHFHPVTPKPAPSSLVVPGTTSRGLTVGDAYALEIEVDTSVVPPAILPAGRRSITDDDFPACVAEVRNLVLSLYPNGDQPIG